MITATFDDVFALGFIGLMHALVVAGGKSKKQSLI
jgi:hypothetical protein